VGRVRRAHGIRGEVVVEALTDAPDAVFAPGRRVFAGTREGEKSRNDQELVVLRSTPFKDGWIVAFDRITDRTQAEAWRDRYLLLPEEEVEPPDEDEVFIHDLIGMRVVRASGENVGEVSEVFELPQGLVIEVQRSRGSAVLLPFNDQTVTRVDTEHRVIEVDPVEGLIE
jgi:16S rRNA processing protein RimM